MTHYIVVRRDLPFGALIANIAHAAGESFYQLGRGSSEKEQWTFSPQVAGSSPAPGSITHVSTAYVTIPSRLSEDTVPRTPDGGSNPSSGANPSETVVVILGARNEGRLARLVDQLVEDDIPHVAIHEPDFPWNGALMAVGLVPGDRSVLSPYINDYHMLPEPD